MVLTWRIGRGGPPPGDEMYTWKVAMGADPMQLRGLAARTIAEESKTSERKMRTFIEIPPAAGTH